MTYNIAAAGQHAPGYLRLAFEDAVERFAKLQDNANFDTAWTLVGLVHCLSGMLWNCTDVMPDQLRSNVTIMGQVGDEPVHTYAEGARLVRDQLSRRKPRLRIKALLEEVH